MSINIRKEVSPCVASLAVRTTRRFRHDERVGVPRIPVGLAIP